MRSVQYWLKWVLLFCSLFLTLGSVAFAETESNEIRSLHENWFVTNGIVSPKEVEQTKWTFIPNAMDIQNPEYRFSDQQSYLLKLQELSCDRCAIYFYFIGRDYEVWIDGEGKFAHGNVANLHQPTFLKKEFLFFQFDSKKQGNEILIQTRADDRYIGMIPDILVGNPEVMLKELLKKQFLTMFSAVLSVFCGIIVMFIYFPVRKELVYLYFGFASITVGIYQFCRTDISLYYLDFGVYLYYLEYISLISFPLFIWLFIKELILKKFRFPNFMITLMLFFNVVYITLQMVFDVPFYKNLIYAQLMILVSILVLIVTTIFMAVKKNREAKRFSFIFIFAFVFGLFDLIMALQSSGKLTFLPLASFLFILGQIYVLVRRIQDMHDEMESWNAQLEVQVDGRTKQVRTLLNQSAQGFFTIRADGNVENEFSSACIRIFGKHPAGQNVLELLFPEHVAEQEMVKSLIQDLFAAPKIQAMQAYLGLFPEELRIGKLSIGCTVRTIESADGRLDQLMFILDDLTEKRSLENQLKSEEKLMRMIVAVLTYPREYRDLVDEYRYFVQVELKQIPEDIKAQSNLLAYVLRMTHTFKGNFAQYGSVALSSELQQIESDLVEMNDLPVEAQIQAITEFNWIQPLMEEIAMMQEIIEMPWLTSQIDEISVDRNELIALRERIVQFLKGPAAIELTDAIEKMIQQPFRKLLEPLANYTMQLASRLEKWINLVDIEGGEFGVDPDRWRAWAKTLVHVVRNQLDHGIEDVDTRLESGKSEQGKIEIEITEDRSGQGFIVIFRDDGAGINYARLREKLIEKQILSLEEAGSMSDGELNRYLFIDQVSTKQEVSELSGRGVGLAAVKEETEKLGGRIEVHSVPGQGTEMRFVFAG